MGKAMSSRQATRLRQKIERALVNANEDIKAYSAQLGAESLKPRVLSDLLLNLHRCQVVDSFTLDSEVPKADSNQKDGRILLTPNMRAGNKTLGTELCMALYGGQERVEKVINKAGKETSVRFVDSPSHGTINIVAVTSRHQSFVTTPPKDKSSPRAQYGDEPHHQLVANNLFVQDWGDGKVHTYLVSIKKCLEARKPGADILSFTSIKELAGSEHQVFDHEGLVKMKIAKEA